jgi:hypothetical protein
MLRAKYDKLKMENEQLRRFLRLLLADSARDALEGNEIQQRSAATVDHLDALLNLSQSVVNVDVRGGNITDVGGDIHNHYQWALISLKFVQFIIVVYKCDADSDDDLQ